MNGSNYQSYFGLRQAPFDEATDPAYLFMTPSIQSALNGIVGAINNDEPYAVLTAEAGGGKSVIARVLPSQLGNNCVCASIADAQMGAKPMLQTMLEAFAVQPTANTDDQDGQALTEQLNAALTARHNNNERCVLIIDDAHALPMDVLYWLCQLGRIQEDDRKLLQIALIGNGLLLQSLRNVQMHELLQRSSAWFRVEALDTAQVEGYFQFRLSWAGLQKPIHFDPDALAMIHKHTEGRPRRLHKVFDSLLEHLAGQERWTVTAADIRAATGEVEKNKPQPQTPQPQPKPVAPSVNEPARPAFSQSWQRAVAAVGIVAAVVGAAASGIIGGSVRTTHGKTPGAVTHASPSQAPKAQPRVASQPQPKIETARPVEIEAKPATKIAAAPQVTPAAAANVLLVEPESDEQAESKIAISVKRDESAATAPKPKRVAKSKGQRSRGSVDDAWTLFEQMTDAKLSGDGSSITPAPNAPKSKTAVDEMPAWGVVVGSYESRDRAQLAAQSASQHLHHTSGAELQAYVAQSGEEYVGLMGGLRDEVHARQVKSELDRFGYESRALLVHFPVAQ